MKILYAIQGTGNGHLSRAKEIIPILKKYGEVDILVSGTQCEITLGHPIKYQLHGYGFIFGKNGGVDFRKTLQSFRMKTFINDVKKLPVRNYDHIINDFEPVCAWSCRLKKVKSIGLSHQSAYLSPKTPQLKGFHWGKYIMKYYAPSSRYFSFHFKKYDQNIYTPVIRSEIRELTPENHGHYTVYLPAYSDEKILKHTTNFPTIHWHIFSKHSKTAYRKDNTNIYPINNEGFTESLRTCEGLLTGGGFEGPAEALYLGKKLLCVPMTNQYEQQCNALALEQLGVPVIWNKKEFNHELKNWIQHPQKIDLHFPNETQDLIKKILDDRIL